MSTEQGSGAWRDTCAEVVGSADDLVDGTLPEPRAEQVRRHLVGCPGCTTHVDQVRAVVRLLGGLGPGGRSRA